MTFGLPGKKLKRFWNYLAKVILKSFNRLNAIRAVWKLLLIK